MRVRARAVKEDVFFIEMFVYLEKNYIVQHLRVRVWLQGRLNKACTEWGSIDRLTDWHMM